MPIIDLHCDTLTELLIQKKSLAQNNLRISVESLKKGGVLAQFFAMYIRLSDYETTDGAWDYMLSLYEIYRRSLAESSDLLPATNFTDFTRNRRENKISAFLTVEEGGILGESMERLEELYHMGVRLITLTWNFQNSLGHPNSDDPTVMNAGLSPFGIEVVKRMGELGMLVDVSHLSDGGFWDVARLCPGPFVASHSNARTVTDFRRNANDKMLRTLAEHGGITGVNFYSKFLGSDGSGSVAQMIEHMRHIKKVAGIDVLAIGSDFDGFGGNCEIQGSAEFYKLTDALAAGGFSSDEIDRITWKNASRVIENVLK